LDPRNTNPLLSDFRKFLYFIWKHLQLPDPTPLQYDIAHWLQHGPKRQIIEAFRGVGKSWVTSTYAIWRLLRDPDEKIMVVSASKNRADDFSTFTLRLIREVPILNHLRPDPTKGHRESKISFDVGPSRASHSPSVKSVGIFGQLAGSRATHIIADDIEVPNNSATEDLREKLLKAVEEFEAILVPEGTPRVTYLGTPQTEESVYNKLAEKGYTLRIWPARFPTVEACAEKYSGRIAPYLTKLIETGKGPLGHPTDPQRFNQIELSEREASYGRTGFALQFMLDTAPSDAEKYPLRLSDLIVMPCDVERAPFTVQYGSSPDLQIKHLQNVGFDGDRLYRPMFYDREKWSDYEGVVMVIDPSGRGKDETAYCVAAQLHGKIFILAAGGLSGGYSRETIQKLALIAKHCKVRRVISESNFGDGMFTEIIKPIFEEEYPVAIEEIRVPNTQKEVRIIDTLEPVMNQHRLIIDESVAKADIKHCVEVDRNHSLLNQLTRITKARGALKHDDRIDVLHLAVWYWTKSMARNTEKAADQATERLLDKELALHMKYLVNGRPQPNGNDMRVRRRVVRNVSGVVSPSRRKH
jgi:hypothetical protein